MIQLPHQRQSHHHHGCHHQLSEVTSPTQSIEDDLQKEFPEATLAEVQPFVTSCRRGRS